jgi:hypothetical protein
MDRYRSAIRLRATPDLQTPRQSRRRRLARLCSDTSRYGCIIVPGGDGLNLGAIWADGQRPGPGQLELHANYLESETAMRTPILRGNILTHLTISGRRQNIRCSDMFQNILERNANL